jgi:hypothetical protein
MVLDVPLLCSEDPAMGHNPKPYEWTKGIWQGIIWEGGGGRECMRTKLLSTSYNKLVLLTITHHLNFELSRTSEEGEQVQRGFFPSFHFYLFLFRSLFLYVFISLYFSCPFEGSVLMVLKLRVIRRGSFNQFVSRLDVGIGNVLKRCFYMNSSLFRSSPALLMYANLWGAKRFSGVFIVTG